MILLFRKSKQFFQIEISLRFLIILQYEYVEKHETLRIITHDMLNGKRKSDKGQLIQ